MSRFFDGEDDSIITESNLDLSDTPRITISLWLYWNAFADDDDLALEFSPNLNVNNGSFLLNPNSSGASRFQVAIRNNSVSLGRSFTRPSALTWHYYNILLDFTIGSGTSWLDIHEAYVDGVLQAWNDDVGPANTGNGNFGSYKLHLMNRGGASLFGAGRMAYLHIHKRLLSTNEMNQLRYFPGSIRKDLAIFYPLWGTSSPEPDYSGNNNSGTVTGATKGATDPPINGLYYPQTPVLHGIT